MSSPPRVTSRVSTFITRSPTFASSASMGSSAEATGMCPYSRSNYPNDLKTLLARLKFQRTAGGYQE